MWYSLIYYERDKIGSEWPSSSEEILVAARTAPDSGCKDVADVIVYRLDAESAEILQTYKAKEAHRVFADDDLPSVDEEKDEF